VTPRFEHARLHTNAPKSLDLSTAQGTLQIATSRITMTNINASCDASEALDEAALKTQRESAHPAEERARREVLRPRIDSIPRAEELFAGL
jgi:hypothetical protein